MRIRWCYRRRSLYWPGRIGHKHTSIRMNICNLDVCGAELGKSNLTDLSFLLVRSDLEFFTDCCSQTSTSAAARCNIFLGRPFCLSFQQIEPCLQARCGAFSANSADCLLFVRLPLYFHHPYQSWVANSSASPYDLTDYTWVLADNKHIYCR